MAVLDWLFGIFGVIYLQMERLRCGGDEAHLVCPFGWMPDSSDGGLFPVSTSWTKLAIRLREGFGSSFTRRGNDDD